MTLNSDENNECKECGKSFSHNEKLNKHIRIKHTVKPCTCPFCGDLLDNKSYLRQHIKQFHRDVSTAEKGSKKMKKEIKINKDLLEEFPMSICETEYNSISAKKEMHASTDMKNDTKESEKEHSSEDPVNIKFETNYEHKDKDEPHPCPYCVGTILKNKTYLIMHLNRFHEGYKLPEMKNEYLTTKTDTGDGFLNTGRNEFNEIVDTEIKLETKKEENSFSENYAHSAEKIKKFICNYCGKAFEKSCLLKRHEFVHSNQKPFVCSDCPKTFTSKAGIDYHKLSHTNEKPFMCDLCSQTFRTKFWFKQHKLVHTGEKPYTCDECGKAFRIKHVMKTHKKIGNCGETEPLICDKCSKTFIYGTNLKNHEKKCNGAKFYFCSQCGKTWRSKIKFQDHTCDKEVKICSICGKEFKNSVNLRRHQRTHQTGTENYVECEVCGKTCKSKFALRYHMSYVHPIGEYHICSFCGKEFKNSQNLRQHERKSCSQTGDQTHVTCPICLKEFVNKHALYSHNYSVHTIENVNCPNCGKTCKSKLALRLHIKRSCALKINIAYDVTPVFGIQGEYS